MKYAAAIRPEQRNATHLVLNPIRIRMPPTSSIVPAIMGKVPSLGPTPPRPNSFW